MSEETTFWDTVDELRETRPRYAREAYGFVAHALSVTVLALPKERQDDPERRHLSGGELLEGVVALARAEFGPLATMVFREWGVRAAADVGEIVFELVRAGQLSARPEDTLEDFRNGLDLAAELARDGGFRTPSAERGNGPSPAA